MPTPEEMEAMLAQQGPSINEGLGPEAAQAMLQPDDEIRMIILSRLESLTPEELQILNRLIDGNSARILLKILPELEDLIGAAVARRGSRMADAFGPAGAPAGALAQM